MKRLLALGALAVSMTGCLGVQVEVFSATNLATAKEACNSSKELELAFDYIGEFSKLEFSFTPNGQTTATTIDVLPDVSTPGFRRYGTQSNKYQMAINLQQITSSPTPTTQAVTVTPKPGVPQPSPLTIYPMDISLNVIKTGNTPIKLSVLNVNVAKCYDLAN
jgi:hypothetical protein